MTATVTAAFVGGPLDGQVRAVEHGATFVHAATYDGTEDLFRAGDVEPFRTIPSVRKVTYLRHDVALFGRTVTAYAPTGLRREEREALIREAMLSPLAKGLLS